MALQEFDGFCGPTNRTSKFASSERTVNRYLEVLTAGTPKRSTNLQLAPALQPYVGLYAGPVRATFFQDGRCFAIGGGILHEVFPSQTVTVRGSVALDAFPATIASNGSAGNQLLITSGGFRYVYNLLTNVLTQIVDDVITVPVVSGTFCNGFFIVLDNTGFIWWSTLEDGTQWDGLDFFAESQVSDQTIAMTNTHGELWLYGTQHTAPLVNVADAFNPFQPLPSSIMQVGTAAPFSAVNILNTAIWIGQNSDGTGTVYVADGYQPTPISSTAIAYKLSTVTADQMLASVGFTFQMRGHNFYGLLVPGLSTTLVYDLTTKAWSEFGLWDTRALRYVPWPVRNHQFAFGQHLFGDRQSGMIYAGTPDLSQNLVYLS